MVEFYNNPSKETLETLKKLHEECISHEYCMECPYAVNNTEDTFKRCALKYMDSYSIMESLIEKWNG